MSLRAAIAALLLLILGGCAGRATPPATVQRPDVDVEVVRAGAIWTASFEFSRPSPVWVFARSAVGRTTERPWRPESWSVETPGVRLERRGRYDVLVAENGGAVPSRVRIRFIPHGQDLIADYDPALVFTDGSVALYNQHFEAFPVASAEAAAQLPIDLDDVPESQAVTRVTFRDRAGPVLHAGRRQASVTLSGRGSYVLFGPARPIVTDAMAAVLDPQLPLWLREFLASATPRILAQHAATLGPPPGEKPTFLVSWAGPTRGVRSMGGSVVPGIVIMRFEGDVVLQETPGLRDHARWFIAHEGAHFWLGQAVHYQTSRDAWITEGGADLLAIRTVSAVDPAYDWRGELNRSIADCASLSSGRGITSARERNEHRAYYACGAVFGLVAEGLTHQPFSAFVRRLIDENRSDGVLTRAEWLAALGSATTDRSIVEDIERLLDQGVADPKPVIASLLRRAGVPHRLDSSGLPLLT